MRISILVLALLPLGASAADPDDRRASEPPYTTTAEESVVVTATREPRDALTAPASVSRIGGEELAELSAKHQAEVLNEIAGVYIQRGSGAESLGGIRSPVLTGAGGCGAFLVAEDSLPIRPVGFCNLNEMFEVNYEQAGSIEVLRGPGSAMFGASAVHGIVNVITPDSQTMPGLFLSAATGSDSFKRVAVGTGTLHRDGPWLGVYGVATRAPGWRDGRHRDGRDSVLGGRAAGLGPGVHVHARRRVGRPRGDHRPEVPWASDRERPAGRFVRRLRVHAALGE
jgi:outer membrane cobalamin receptor